MPDSENYLLTILAHFCLEPQNRTLVLSDGYKPAADEFRQFSDLSQIAQLMTSHLFSANPAWTESARAHLQLYSGNRSGLLPEKFDKYLICMATLYDYARSDKLLSN